MMGCHRFFRAPRKCRTNKAIRQILNAGRARPQRPPCCDRIQRVPGLAAPPHLLPSLEPQAELGGADRPQQQPAGAWAQGGHCLRLGQELATLGDSLISSLSAGACMAIGKWVPLAECPYEPHKPGPHKAPPPPPTQWMWN